jgi:hypothetical protein
MENRGISITGGTVTTGAMAAGDHAVAVNEAAAAQQPALEDLRQALHHLTRVIEAGSTALDLPERSVAVAAARMAEQEGAKEAPDKARLSGLLSVLTSGAGAVSGVAAAVTAVEAALQALL